MYYDLQRIVLKEIKKKELKNILDDFVMLWGPGRYVTSSGNGTVDPWLALFPVNITNRIL